MEKGQTTMTVGGLIAGYKRNKPEGHFFDKDTLKFWGEKVSEMKISRYTEKIKDCYGKEHECYVLKSLQHNNPIEPTWVTHYFEVGTFDQIIKSDKED